MGLLRVLVRSMGEGFCIVILLGEEVFAFSLFVISYRKTFKPYVCVCAIHYQCDNCY